MIYYEYQRYGDTDPLTISEWDNLNYPYLHFHGHFELICLYDGQLQITLDNSTFLMNPGQFLLVFPNQIHALSSMGHAHARVCIFASSLVNSFFQNAQNKVPQNVILDFEDNVAHFVNANLSAQSNNCMIKAVLYAVCAEISNKTSFVSQQNTKNTLLVHQLISYISQNFASNISLHTAATDLGYSYQYLSNQLQKYNISFPTLLNQYRLDYAMYLLKHTDDLISDIAFACGYSNLRTFNRNFLNFFKVSPRHYRSSDNSARFRGQMSYHTAD